MGMLEARFGHGLDRRVRRLVRAPGLLGTLSYFVIVECGLERVLAVVEAEEAFAAFAGTASRLWGKRARTVFSIVDNPRPGVWAAYELSEEFADPRAWKMFGLDTVRHGKLSALAFCYCDPGTR